MFHTKAVKKIKTHFIFSNFIFQKLCHWRDNVVKCSRVGQVTDGSMERTHCYKHTFGICKFFAFLWQQWLHKCTSVLHDMYIACLVVKIK